VYTSNYAVRRRRAGIILLAALSGPACHAWHTERLGPEALLVSRQPAQLRVTLADSSQIVLERPALRGDTLVGIGQDQGEGDVMRIPLTDIRELATRRISVVPTVALITVGLYAAFGAAVAIACASPSSQAC